jgi:Raf kinase inhibitor-like YbhB/YbcL family protein
MTFQLTSPAFAPHQPIPIKHTGDGEDLSPPLVWEGVPPTTQEFALLCDDPDAPTPQPWVHWVLLKIPATTRELPEGVPQQATLTVPCGAIQGLNSWPVGENLGYRGPLPPRGHGTHHYHFKLFALNSTLPEIQESDKEALLKAIEGKVLAEADLIGTYERLKK